MKDVRGLLLHAPRRYRRERRAGTLLDAVCRLYGTPRLDLPAVDLETAFPGFAEREVTVRRLALGHWSSPTVAQVVLAKLAGVIGARRILELGSFRGYTARLLAENLPDAEIVALDTDAKQGEAFRCSEVASRIAVVTGTVADLPRESQFDLIYLDADHRRPAVERDTRAALGMLGKDGVLVWHDYADWGWVNEENRVPEVLNSLARTIAVGQIKGLALAIHRRGWTRSDLEAATIREDGGVAPAWESRQHRG